MIDSPNNTIAPCGDHPDTGLSHDVSLRKSSSRHWKNCGHGITYPSVIRRNLHDAMRYALRESVRLLASVEKDRVACFVEWTVDY